MQQLSSTSRQRYRLAKYQKAAFSNYQAEARQKLLQRWQRQRFQIHQAGLAELRLTLQLSQVLKGMS
jgi:hypothetical protein